MISAYGESPCPVIEGPAALPRGEINYTGTLDRAAPCLLIEDAAHLTIHHLTVYHACYGLLLHTTLSESAGITREDVLAVDIHNFEQNELRIDLAGIEVAVERGRSVDGGVLQGVTVRRCTCYRTGTGFRFWVSGHDTFLENLLGERITSHDHANAPWSYVGLLLDRVRHARLKGVCLGRCAPPWKPTGTVTVRHCRFQRRGLPPRLQSRQPLFRLWSPNTGSCLLNRTGPPGRYPEQSQAGRVHRIAGLRCDTPLTRFIVDRKALETTDERPIPAGRQPWVLLYVPTSGSFRDVRVYVRDEFRLPVPRFPGRIALITP